MDATKLLNDRIHDAEVDLWAIRRRQVDPTLRDPGTDKENDHIEADAIVMQLLRDIGAGKVADVFDKIDKWYA